MAFSSMSSAAANWLSSAGFHVELIAALRNGAASRQVQGVETQLLAGLVHAEALLEPEPRALEHALRRRVVQRGDRHHAREPVPVAGQRQRGLDRLARVAPAPVPLEEREAHVHVLERIALAEPADPRALAVVLPLDAP